MHKSKEANPGVMLWSDLGLERIKQKLAEITERIEKVHSKYTHQSELDYPHTQHKRY